MRQIIIAGKSTYITKESKGQIETAEAVKYDGNNLDEVARIVKAAGYRIDCPYSCEYNSLYVEAIIKVKNHLWDREDVFLVTPIVTFMLRRGEYVVKSYIKTGHGRLSAGYDGFQIMSEDEFNDRFE